MGILENPQKSQEILEIFIFGLATSVTVVMVLHAQTLTNVVPTRTIVTSMATVLTRSAPLHALALPVTTVTDRLVQTIQVFKLCPALLT